MMSKIRKHLRRMVKRQVRSFGYELSRKGWETNRLRKDFQISTLIDIGVFQGTPELYRAFPEAKLLLIEANPVSWSVMDRILADRSGFGARVAAGAVDGELDLYSYPDAPGVSSFVFRQDHANFRRELVKIPVKPLDEIVASSGLLGPYGLKIDIEGFELAALQGAAKTLKSTDFVIFESQIQSIDPKPYSQAEIFSFLETAGFELCDVVYVAYDHASRKTKQADLMFQRVERLK